MKKNIIVIDGLARSGTTLLTAFFNSQERCTAYREIFHEPLACRYAAWAHGYAMTPVMEKDIKIRFPQNRLMSFFSGKAGSDDLVFDVDYFFEFSLEKLIKRQQFQHMPVDGWRSFFEEQKINNTAALDEFYQALAKRFEVNNLFFRWNQGWSYITKWLRNPNHYWVIPVRHPVARAYSHHRSHNIPYERALEESIAFAQAMEKIQQMSLANTGIIYYEDLVRDGLTEIHRLLDVLKITINNTQLDKLLDSSGTPYRVETSNLVDQNRDRLSGEEYKGLSTGSIDSYKDKVDLSIQQLFQDKLGGYDVYKKYFV